jgi:hypothetical protein
MKWNQCEEKNACAAIFPIQSFFFGGLINLEVSLKEKFCNLGNIERFLSLSSSKHCIVDILKNDETIVSYFVNLLHIIRTVSQCYFFLYLIFNCTRTCFYFSILFLFHDRLHKSSCFFFQSSHRSLGEKRRARPSKSKKISKKDQNDSNCINNYKQHLVVET